MAEGKTVKKVFKNTPECKGYVGKPRKRWLRRLGKCEKNGY
jgi:hypothetical protein